MPPHRPRPPAPGASARIRAVVLDIGETCVNTWCEYRRWAEWLGVPAHTFAAAVGAAIVRGGDEYDALSMVRPDIDPAVEVRRRASTADFEAFGEEDLYPDVRPALTALRQAGVWVAVVGNQSLASEATLRQLDLPCDLVATSASWGVRKPDAEYFERIVRYAPCRRQEILHVGDRVDNDIRPANQAGLLTAHLRRGPWGCLSPPRGDRPEDRPTFGIDSLTELPGHVLGTVRP
ncbi:HAD family hydrolase [Kitasatospora misakiensis]|uniref:HAD family hydrolase n=1 Tax=Kitasatospora misakiensis TaxID=67330 RepID=A0ABW0WTI9_9ACTN